MAAARDADYANMPDDAWIMVIQVHLMWSDQKSAEPQGKYSILQLCRSPTAASCILFGYVLGIFTRSDHRIERSDSKIAV